MIVCIPYRSHSIAAMLCLVALATHAAGQAPAFEPFAIEIPRLRSGTRWADLDGNGLLDLLVADDSRIQIHYQTPDGGFDGARTQTIDAPGGAALFDLAELDGAAPPELVFLTAEGVISYRYDPATGALRRAEVPLLDGMRGVPMQHLAPANFMFDIDSDGDEDILYPVDGKYYLFFREGEGFIQRNQIASSPINVSLSLGENRLRDRLSASVRIPRLTFEEINGDGRLDLLVHEGDRRYFHIQSEDGVIPEQPSYTLDLSRFRQPRERGRFELAGPNFQFLTTDLNADRDRDYLIVSGNRIWVFMGGEGGVNFDEPDQIIKVTADRMNAILLPLDGDDRPDLVIIKYEMPSMGRLVAGLAVGLRFEIELLGYNGVEGGTFSRRPDHRSTMVFKIPPLLKLLGEVESLTEQFENIGQASRSIATGDFDGDGERDVIRAADETLDVFLTGGDLRLTVEGFDLSGEDKEIFRRILFEEKRRVVTLETIVSVVTDVLGSIQAQAVQGREPSFRIPVEPGLAERLESLSVRDLNADGFDDVILYLGEPEGAGPAGETQTLRLWLSRPAGHDARFRVDPPRVIRPSPR